MRLTRSRNWSVLEQCSAVILVALLSAGLWLGWFAWDTEYQIDPDTGDSATPHRLYLTLELLPADRRTTASREDDV